MTYPNYTYEYVDKKWKQMPRTPSDIMSEHKITELREIVNQKAPKDRNILLKVVVYTWDRYRHVPTGFKWVEGLWCKDMSGKERFCIWTGDRKSHTTESCVPISWAELPNA